jgi:hypothetical protein
MADARDPALLEALLDACDRHTTILLNLLRALPERGLEARAMEGSPSDAVESRLERGLPMDFELAHPSHLIDFLIFHESYHHGQIKLALKAAGRPLMDDVAGPLTWAVWRARR